MPTSRSCERSAYGITVKGLRACYLYLERIKVAASKPPVARVEIESDRTRASSA